MSHTALPLRDGRFHDAESDDSVSISPPTKFLRALSIERARADRNSHEFSLVTLRVLDSSHCQLLEEIVCQWQLRPDSAVGQAGWLDCDRLAILLPASSTATAADAARSILEAVVAASQDVARSVEWRVDTYPGNVHQRRHQWQSFDWSCEANRNGHGVRQDSDAEPMSALIGVHSSALANGPADALPCDQRSVSAAPYIQRLVIRPCPRWKRAMDIAGALTGLVVLSPLLLIVATFIKCVSRGPVFFCQRRYGLAGRPFTMWKFRTIETSRSQEDQQQSHVADLMQNGRPLEKRDLSSCIIPGGAVLRRFGIDELPQLFNVLRGEMSLVGPRPDVLPLAKYQVWQRRRFDVEPGITGLWQVSGKNHTTFTTMIRLDIAYVRRRSFWLDVSILLRTIAAVLRN